MSFDEKLFRYCLQHTTQPDPVLQQLERETHLRTLYPQMLTGPFQGMLLQMISRMINPMHILEIGTFTGYGSICLAQGLQPGGQLHTIEVDDERTPIIRQHLRLAGLEHQVVLHLGDAAEIVPDLPHTFDLAFLDAGKMDYARHYELVLPKIRAGGFLLADNVLWSGKVLHDEKDATATALRDFNDRVQADERVDNLLLPLRDGLMLVRKH